MYVHRNINLSTLGIPHACLSSPFHYAIEKGDIKLVEGAFKYGSYVDRQKNNITPLFLAVQLGHIDIVELLLDQMNSKALNISCTRMNIYPIEQAMINKDIKMFKFLLEYYVGYLHIDPIFLKLMNNAVVFHLKDFCEVLIKRDKYLAVVQPKNNFYNKPALHHAFAKDAGWFFYVLLINDMQHLVHRYIDKHINSMMFRHEIYNCNLMYVSAKEDNSRCIELMVSYGSRALDKRILFKMRDGTTRMMTPLDIAIFEDRSNAIRTLYALGATCVDNHCSELLNLAIRGRFPSLVTKFPDEEEIIGIRYRSYFSRSLANILLFNLKPHPVEY